MNQQTIPMQVYDIAVKAVAIFAAQHPRPTQVTCQQAAQMLNLSARTVKRILADNGVVRNKCGLYPIEEIDRLRTKSAHEG